MKKSEKIFSQFCENPEFMKLEEVGGQKKFHQEGNALVHTRLVLNEAEKEFTTPEEEFMLTVAALHDIGKIYTSWQDSKSGDWFYPDHSTCGGLSGILRKFVDPKDPMFPTYQWYITNHIRPLFWRGKGKVETTRPVSNLCTTQRLARLAICDIKGSISDEPQDELITYLRSI